LAFDVADTAGNAEFYGVRGLRCEHTAWGMLRVWVPAVCPFLTCDGLCGIEDDKPLVCRVFPEPGMELLDGCGYG